MKTYSVMVKRPVDISEPGVDVDFYMAIVEAKDMREAEEMAQDEAYAADKCDMGEDWPEDICAIDYRVIAVFEGHVKLVGFGGY